MIPALCALVVVAVVVAVKDGVVGMPLVDLEGKDTDHVLTMIQTHTRFRITTFIRTKTQHEN